MKKNFFKKVLICFLFGYLSWNKLAIADEDDDQSQILRNYYISQFNNQLITFDNLSNFVFNDTSDRIFINKKNSGLLSRLNNNWIKDSESNYRAYNINLDLGYSFILSNFLIMPIFEFGFTSGKINDNMKADLNNWSFVIPGIYTFYGFENGIFGDIFFSYRLDNGSNKTKDFENYNKSKNEQSFNVRTSIGWNFTFEDNLSLTPRIAFDYNKLYLNSNNIIDKNWFEPNDYYENVDKINYDIFYIIPAVKLEFNNMFRDSSILSYIINFFSVDFKYRKDVGSKDNAFKNEFVDYSGTYKNEFAAIVAFGLKTKLGLWYSFSFERIDAFHLDLGYRF